MPVRLGSIEKLGETLLPSLFRLFVVFPDSSVGKESACNAGDPGLIPGPGRSAGEGIGYPLQYSWASLVAQLVKNLDFRGCRTEAPGFLLTVSRDYP